MKITEILPWLKDETRSSLIIAPENVELSAEVTGLQNIDLHNLEHFNSDHIEKKYHHGILWLPHNDAVKQCQHFIAKLRDQWCDDVVVIKQANCEINDVELIGLGFTKSVIHPHVTVFTFDIATYKTTPEWLNNRYWANPEMFNRYHW